MAYPIVLKPPGACLKRFTLEKILYAKEKANARREMSYNIAKVWI
jgi:hypothetical protein